MYSKKVQISLILAIIVIAAVAWAIAGCATDKGASIEEPIKIKAGNVADGIRLTFNHIPAETNRLFIILMEVIEGEDPVTVTANIDAEALKSVKETGFVICPFVQRGHNYRVAVYHEKNEVYDPSNWIYAEITPNNGTYVLNNVNLELNKNRTAVSLSQEPMFSSNVEFSSKKYSYAVTVKKNENWAIGYSATVADASAWDFSSMADDLKKDDIFLDGTLPAYVTASCNVNYNKLEWRVDIARTDGFTVSF